MAEPQHLNASHVEPLLRGDPELSRYFRQHLAQPCEICEQFLATEPRLGLLDGSVDLLLQGVAPGEEAELDEVGFARIQRALKPPKRTAWRAVPVMVGALAASLLVVLGVQRLRSAPEVDPAEVGVKGAPRLSLELTAAAALPGERVVRVDQGQTLGADAVLMLRYHASESGTALLLRQREGGEVEALGSFPLLAGTHDLGAQGQVMGIPLADERGEVTFWLWVAPSNQALTAERARAWLQAGTPPSGDAAVRLRVRVEPAGQPPRP